MDTARFPFLVMSRDGRRVASAEHFEDALFWMRTLPEAKRVVRNEDGVELAKLEPLRDRRPFASRGA